VRIRFLTLVTYCVCLMMRMGLQAHSVLKFFLMLGEF